MTCIELKFSRDYYFRQGTICFNPFLMPLIHHYNSISSIVSDVIPVQCQRCSLKQFGFFLSNKRCECSSSDNKRKTKHDVSKYLTVKNEKLVLYKDAYLNVSSPQPTLLGQSLSSSSGANDANPPIQSSCLSSLPETSKSLINTIQIHLKSADVESLVAMPPTVLGASILKANRQQETHIRGEISTHKPAKGNIGTGKDFISLFKDSIARCQKACERSLVVDLRYRLLTDLDMNGNMNSTTMIRYESLEMVKVQNNGNPQINEDVCSYACACASGDKQKRKQSMLGPDKKRRKEEE